MTSRVFKILVAAAITGLLCWGVWWLWTEVPGLIRRTEISDFSYFAGLLAIFLCLSVLHPILGWLWKKLFPPST